MSYNRWRIFERDGFRCVYCGAHASEAKLHVDHRHPRRWGGTNHELNLVTACAPCNLSKRDKLPRWEPCSPSWPEDGYTWPSMDCPGMFLMDGHSQAVRILDGFDGVSTGEYCDVEVFWGPRGCGAQSCFSDDVWEPNVEEAAAQ